MKILINLPYQELSIRPTKKTRTKEEKKVNIQWCGRNNREKIGTHVVFDEELDISPFCKRAPSVPKYRLNAVVVHHGAGFRAGHYTAFVYNNSAGSWLHCNDSRIQLVSLEEVLASQAYILFYSTELATVSLEDLPAVPTQSVPESDLQSNISTIPEVDQETLQTLRRGETQHNVDDEVMLSFHRDPVLVKRLSSSTFGSPQSTSVQITSTNTTCVSTSIIVNSVSATLNPNPGSKCTSNSALNFSVSSPAQKIIKINSESRQITQRRKRQMQKTESSAVHNRISPSRKISRQKSRSL
ncbi:ubiquitin carboxyl-terminal hydrolase 44 [Elysia marginata]|uniref:Ubiquitin carboxyl-terminal hydrolase 44 n=1 Tax=Elysia marginata TaxID=1093978 RepID=A0AAV4E9S1_9GAST|nr:ubiquitin carboxyl-terminal hydrolase 44 [Elysia marginata]